MEIQEFFNIIKNKKQTIAVVVVLFLLFAVAITFVQPLKYSSESKMLVIQELPERVDPYQISKSNEYISSLLAQVVTTNSFFKEVLNSGFNVDKNYFPEASDKQMKRWKKMVNVSSNSSGIISVKVYHSNRVQVEQINQAINYILISKNQLYHGFGDKLKIKVIEQAVTSEKPVQPNIFINLGLGFLFGLIGSVSFVYLFPDKKYNLYLKPRQKSVAASGQENAKDRFLEEYQAELRQARALSEDDNSAKSYYRKPAVAPVDLPVFDDDNNDLKEIESTQAYQGFEIKGSMDNIIKK